MHLTYITVVCLLAAAATAAAAPFDESREEDADDGDSVESCSWLRRDNPLPFFSVLPGGGWDNLRNSEMGLIADLSLANCQLSADRKYVIPPGIILRPRMTSTVDTSAEILKTFNNYTSAVSASMKSEAHGTYKGITVGGSYSPEFQKVKSKQTLSKSRIIRSQLRYHLHTAHLQPGFRLARPIRQRLEQIADFIETDQTQAARYMSDLIVRDYGTHLVRTVETGAVLQRLDFIKSHDAEKLNKLAAALGIGGNVKVRAANAGLSYTITMAFVNQQIHGVSASENSTSVESFGGPPLGPDMDIGSWIRQLGSNQVAIDRRGVPISDIVSSSDLPAVHPSVIAKIAKSLDDAVDRYYVANTIEGCIDFESTNFDPAANVASDCEKVSLQMKLGGAFQVCSESNPSLGLNLCSRKERAMNSVNPQTGAHSCPQGYEKVKLLTSWGLNGECKKFYRGNFRWALFYYKTECSMVKLTAYWCIVKENATLNAESGFAYGGSYSDIEVNSMTSDKKCAPHYRPFPIGPRIKFCLSSSLKATAKNRIRFGGFFSCRHGNPLAGGRKSCPKGFSRQTLGLADGCEVMECVANRVGSALPVLRRPPFEKMPPPPRKDESDIAVKAMRAVSAVDASDDDEDNDGLGGESAAGADSLGAGIATIVIGCAVIVALLAGVMLAARRNDWVVRFRRWRLRSKGEYRCIDPGQLLPDEAAASDSITYGSVKDKCREFEKSPIIICARQPACSKKLNDN